MLSKVHKRKDVVLSKVHKTNSMNLMIGQKLMETKPTTMSFIYLLSTFNVFSVFLNQQHLASHHDTVIPRFL